MTLVIGTRHEKRRRVMPQLVSLGGTSPKGSIFDMDILCNNKRIKGGMVLDEARKTLEFGGKLGIEISNKEKQIVETFSRMEERDKQGHTQHS
ncbi:hypothetical protein SLE2022_371730 [Rubroshorea leprosula]